jgi:membrane protease subunit HflK
MTHPWDRESFPTPEDLWRSFRRTYGGRVRLLLPFVVLILLVLWIASGTYMVEPGEQGVVRRFGKEVRLTEPGLRYHLPWPIEKVDRVSLQEVKTLAVGFREVRPGRFEPVNHEALMLTGDENIVDIRAIVQYRVKDASEFLFNVRDVEQVLKSSTEVALRGVVGENTIDEVMTEGRARIQQSTQVVLQELMDSYDSGLLVADLKLQEVDAPVQVRDAFHDVVRAKEEREQLIREAEGYQEDLIPKARGEAEKTIREAEAFREQRIIEAEGGAGRFLDILREYKLAAAVTRKRLYLETMEKVLPGIEKVLVESGDGNLLQLLPIRDPAKGSR